MPLTRQEREMISWSLHDYLSGGWSLRDSGRCVVAELLKVYLQNIGREKEIFTVDPSPRKRSPKRIRNLKRRSNLSQRFTPV
mmetsp:Transcript_14789/g.22032  ORF Transcript_14789/g.22032 Transcript_14789/m.22032 type:complete len:82 (-) Transcript_14789:211-456(-)